MYCKLSELLCSLELIHLGNGISPTVSWTLSNAISPTRKRKRTTKVNGNEPVAAEEEIDWTEFETDGLSYEGLVDDVSGGALDPDLVQ